MNIGRDIFLLIIGTILGLAGNFLFQWSNNCKAKNALHVKVFAEIQYNASNINSVERTGPEGFKGFQTDSWKNFEGSDAYKEVPIAAGNNLNKYYNALKKFNDGILSWKKVDGIDLKAADLIKLTEPYLYFLLKKKLISKDDFNVVRNEGSSTFVKVFTFPEQFPVYTAEYDKNLKKSIREITSKTIANDLNEILEQIDDTYFSLAWLTRAKCALLLRNVDNSILEEYLIKYKKDGKKDIGWEEILNALIGRIENDTSSFVRNESLETYKIITSKTHFGFSKGVLKDHWEKYKIDIIKELKEGRSE